MDDCIFCKIIKGDAPATVELDSDKVVAIKNIAPAAETHILIVPKKHILTFMDLEKKDKALFSEMIEVAQALVKKKKIEKGYKLLFNGGKYQGIAHLHWHLMGGKFEEGALEKT